MCHVLIIEDEPLFALHIEMILADAGATSFDFAVTEREAIAAAIACRPGLITSDVKLAEGRGPDAVTAIVEAIGAVPVIFITGTPDDCVPCEPPALLLVKPVGKSEVVSAYHALLGT